MFFVLLSCLFLLFLVFKGFLFVLFVGSLVGWLVGWLGGRLERGGVERRLATNVTNQCHEEGTTVDGGDVGVREMSVTVL